MKVLPDFKKILSSRYFINMKKGYLRVVQNSSNRNFLEKVSGFLSISKKIWKNKKWGLPGLFACKSLPDFSNFHARLRAIQNLDFNNLLPRVFRLFGQRDNAGKTLGTSNFITAGFLR